MPARAAVIGTVETALLRIDDGIHAAGVARRERNSDAAELLGGQPSMDFIPRVAPVVGAVELDIHRVNSIAAHRIGRDSREIERALADARAAEARQMAGALRGRLDGIPIAHKDIYSTAGIRTTAHSKQLEHNVPTRDAHTVGKWADAGTVMLGKLATH